MTEFFTAEEIGNTCLEPIAVVDVVRIQNMANRKVGAILFKLKLAEDILVRTQLSLPVLAGLFRALNFKIGLEVATGLQADLNAALVEMRKP